jgi:hypothetical protein
MFATSLLESGTHVISGRYLGDSNYTGSFSPGLSQVVNQANSASALTSSLNPSVADQSVKFTVMVTAVAPGIGSPTGTVTFFDMGNNVGTGSLNAAGQATLTVTNFAPGTHSMTATYGGDIDFISSATQAATSQVVVAPDFSLSSSSAQPVSAGSAAVYVVTVSPVPSPFVYAVTNFSCAGLPNGTACGINPASVTPNSGSVTTMLTITTTSRILASRNSPGNSHSALFAVCLSPALLGLFGIVAMRDKQRWHGMWLWMALALFCTALAIGCAAGTQGNPPNPNGTPAGTYNITLSASGNGNIRHNTTVILNVN